MIWPLAFGIHMVTCEGTPNRKPTAVVTASTPFAAQLTSAPLTQRSRDALTAALPVSLTYQAERPQLFRQPTESGHSTALAELRSARYNFARRNNPLLRCAVCANRVSVMFYDVLMWKLMIRSSTLVDVNSDAITVATSDWSCGLLLRACPQPQVSAVRTRCLPWLLSARSPYTNLKASLPHWPRQSVLASTQHGSLIAVAIGRCGVI